MAKLASIPLTSPAFADGAPIPARHTADGESVSPTLTWGEPPPGTQSFALICEDPDAPSGTFVHWLVWNIPLTRRELEEGFWQSPETDGIRQGENGSGIKGYSGPKPSPGTSHRYIFRLYALDSQLAVEDGATRTQLEHGLDGHILAEGVLVGTYGSAVR